MFVSPPVEARLITLEAHKSRAVMVTVPRHSPCSVLKSAGPASHQSLLSVRHRGRLQAGEAETAALSKGPRGTIKASEVHAACYCQVVKLFSI